jgi:uncharacterized protein (DUF1501 family)
MKRRDFLLGTGAAGLAALSLRGHRASATERPRQPARRLLLVYATGGWDTTYALDPKEPPVSIPAGTVQRFAGLDVFTDPSRPSVGRFFERHAAVTAIVRGVATDGIFHNECMRRMATGKRDDGEPDLGAMVAHDVGNDLPIPYLILGDTAYAGPYTASSARVGTTNQIVELLGDPAADPVAATEDALLRRYADASIERARATRGATGYNRRRVDDFANALSRSDRLRQLRGRFGARGEATTLAAQIPLALDALEQDLSHAVMLTTREYWDTHTDNFTQADRHETLFANVTVLVDELLRRPGRATGTRMIDDTVVLVFSEMGRTALASGDPGHEGKDHWPITSLAVIGAGVRGGQVFGATTASLGGMLVDLATGQPSPSGLQPLYSNFIAGMLALCGADPSAHFGTTPPLDAFIA